MSRTARPVAFECGQTASPGNGAGALTRRRCGMAAAIVLCAAAGGVLHAVGEDAPASAARPPLPPQLAPNRAFASSHACLDCHADQHASWHRSYHRSMTQTASPENFVGRFDGATINSRGLTYRVFKRGEEFWAEMPDPDEMVDRLRTYEMKKHQGLPAAPPNWRDLPQVERQVVMSTGSHRYQTYWVQSARFPGTLMTLPLVYLIGDQRWIPRETAFMSPPGPTRMVTVWNDHCINCHSTGPRPAPFAKLDPATRRVQETGFHSTVGEIGIACEACHGPAQKHVELRRAAESGELPLADLERLDPIVQPANLADHRRTTEICGQCHGVFIRNEKQGERYRDHGLEFVPGDDLQTTRQYLFPPQDSAFYPDAQSRDEAIAAYQRNREFFRERFWDNGLILAGGREYSALAISQCYRQGTITCLTCHTMHGGDPNDQLKPNMESGAACVTCHADAKYTTEVAAHTHHSPESAGSNCLNCHMPRTTYALFTAIRSHQIQSPDLAGSVTYGTPNACNLCHLDKTLAWTQQHMTDWYGSPRLELSTEQAKISAALVWMLKGHAAQRVIVAWHARWAPAQQASGADWLAPFVAPLLADPYGVVRYVAEHSLRTLPGFEDLKFNFLAPEAELTAAAERATAHWQAQLTGPPTRHGPEVLIAPDGTPSREAIRWLLEHRDNRPVTIKE